ncbi:MAG: AsmA-like C-terminal region-containing protein, partial [Crocinitomicaceae bacterium]
MLWTVGIIISLMILITVGLLIFHKKIENYALSQLNNYLKTEVHVYDMDITFWSTFPSISIEFQKVLITDQIPLPNTKGDTLLFAQKLNLNLNTIEFWKGNYTVKSIDVSDARIGLRVSEDGNVNYDIIKTDKENKDQKFQFSLKDVRFHKLDLTYNNYSSGQHYSIFANDLRFKGNFTRDLYTMSTSGNIVLKEIKSKAVVLLKNKQAEFDLSIQVNRLQNSFILKPSKIQIEHIPFILQAKLIKNSLNLRLEASNLSLSALTDNILSASIEKIKKLKGKGKVDFWLTVNGEIGGSIQPLVKSKFSVHNGSIVESTTNTAITNINLSGEYSNHNGKNEEIRINQFTFHSKYGDFSGKIAINDFEQPVIKGQLNGGIDLGFIHSLFTIKQISTLTGFLQMNTWFHFKMNNPQFDPYNVTIYESKGDFELKNVNITFANAAPEMKQMNGKIVVLGDAAAFDNLRFKTGKSDIAFSGNTQNMIAYFSGKSNLIFDAVVESNKLYSEDFYSKSDIKQSPSNNIGAYLLPQNLQGEVKLKIHSFQLGQHRFDNIYTHITMTNRAFSSSEIQFTHLGTVAAGDLVIRENNPGIIEVSGSMNADSINLKNVFKEWNNFDQKVITSENINGLAQIRLSYYFPFSYQKGLVKEDLVAEVYTKVTNGSLVNVATFQSITLNMRKNAIVKAILNKDIDLFEQKLKNLTFQTLENSFTISKGKIEIPKMEIRSSALDIDISGWHAFNNDLDYHLDFRLRDLKTIQTQTEFGDIIDDGTGMRLFLHLFGNTSQLKFAWDKSEKKAFQDEKRKEEKQNIKSVLKSGLGFYKNDTTVKLYTEKKAPESKIEFSFDHADKKET